MAKDTNELPGVSLDPVKPPFVGAHEESIRRGHELDPINVKPFAQFTAIMLVMFVATWLIAAYAFNMSAEKWSPDGKKNVRTQYDGRVNPLAVELNDRSLDERMARIDTHSPVAKTEAEKVYAPRLEAFKSMDFGGVPEYTRSSNVITKAATNPPVYHPEDLLPSRNALLSNGQWVGKAGAARLPIQTVISNAKELGLKDSLFKSQAGVKSEYDANLYNPSSVTPTLGANPAAPEKASEKDAHHAPEKKDPAQATEKK